MKPILSKINVFSANEDTSFQFGAYADIDLVAYIIFKSKDSTVYKFGTVAPTGTGLARQFVIKGGVLVNQHDPYYIMIRCRLTGTNTFSEYSDKILFYCHEKPSIKFRAFSDISTSKIIFTPSYSFDCPTIDLKEMLPKCTSLNRVRVTGINWELSDTTLLDKLYGMTGLDENGYNSDHSVIEGIVHLPLIREKQLENFKAQWPDLTIEYNTLIEQYTWTFVNKDGSVLDIQYVDKGAKAVDPTTRIDKTNYWTRSPFISYRNYFYSVSETGNLYGYLFPSDQAGIRLMFCV